MLDECHAGRIMCGVFQAEVEPGRGSRGKGRAMSKPETGDEDDSPGHKGWVALPNWDGCNSERVPESGWYPCAKP